MMIWLASQQHQMEVEDDADFLEEERLIFIQFFRDAVEINGEPKNSDPPNSFKLPKKGRLDCMQNNFLGLLLGSAFSSCNIKIEREHTNAWLYIHENAGKHTS